MNRSSAIAPFAAALLLWTGIALFFVFVPPPHPARAEAAVFNVYNNQVDVTSSVTHVALVRTGRFDVFIEQLGSNADIYCGSPKNGAVTTSNGALLPAGKGNTITLHTAAAVDCISVGATARVAYVEDF